MLLYHLCVTYLHVGKKQSIECIDTEFYETGHLLRTKNAVLKVRIHQAFAQRLHN